MADTAQNRELAPLITEDIPEPLPHDAPIVSPPPAYYPPPNNLFRTMSFPVYDAHQAVQSAEQSALQEQYTEYFTQLFTKWIEYAISFYKYGFPVIKWSSFFFIYGTGGWREYFLLAVWGTIWILPGLYFGIVGKEINDVKMWGNNGERTLNWWIYQATFWSVWTAIVGANFVILVFIMRMESWWFWPVWAIWLWLFGW